MSGTNVLITSSNYWPEPAGLGRYVTGVAEHFAATGCGVVVATGFPHYPQWRSGAKGRIAAREARNGVQIRRRWHHVPSRQSAARRAVYEASLLAAGLAGLPRVRPDVVLGFVPSLASGVVAMLAARHYQRPYALVFQDLMGRAAEQSGIAGARSVAAATSATELGVARRAATVGIVAETFRPYLEQGGVAPASIVRLRNWAQPIEPTEKPTETRARLGWCAREFVCLHAGNMGHKQGLENLLLAARMLDGEGIRVVLAGDGNDRQRLQRRTAELGAANVTFLGVQPTGAYEAMLRAADVLVLSQRGALLDMALPSKLTSYFAAGRPVVAAVSNACEAAAEVVASGAGVVVPPDAPAALAATLRELRAAPAKAQVLGTSGRRYADLVLSHTAALRGYEELLERALGRVAPAEVAAAPDGMHQHVGVKRDR